MSRWARWMAGLFAAALALRLGAGLAIGPKEPPVTGDADSFHRIALALVHEGQFALDGEPTGYRDPAYPFFIAFLYRISGDSVRAIPIGQAALGAWTVLLLAGCARRLRLDPRAAAAVGIAGAFYPFFTYYSAQMVTETLALWSLALTYWLLLRWKEQPDAFRWPLAWGLSAGFLSVTKTAFGVWGFLLLLTEGLLRARRGAARWSAWAAAALLFALLPALWMARNVRALGTPKLVTRGGMTCMECMVFYEWNKSGDFNRFFEKQPLYAQTHALSEPERDAIYAQVYRKFIRDHPAVFLRRAMANLADVWRLYPRQDLSGPSPARLRLLALVSLATEPALLFFGAWGFWLVRREWRVWYPAWMAIALLTAVHAVSCAQMRYRLPLMLFFMIAAAVPWSNHLRRRGSPLSGI